MTWIDRLIDLEASLGTFACAAMGLLTVVMFAIHIRNWPGDV